MNNQELLSRKKKKEKSDYKELRRLIEDWDEGM